MGTFSASAQVVDASGQYVDTVFNDNVDRAAEDFVKVSLMISQPSDCRVSAIFGHAALRLQCPTFGLDYVFSYVSIYSDASALDYLVIRPTMGLAAISTNSYVEDEFRGVSEYDMYLPPNVEVELWRILDEEAAKGFVRPYDCVAGSCAQMVYSYVNRAISHVYPMDSLQTSWQNEPKCTMHELMNLYAKNAPWQLLLINSVLGSSYVDDVNQSNAKKVLFPIQLLELWHNTRLAGKPILASSANIHKSAEVMKSPTITPIWLAIIVLLMSVCSLLTILIRKNTWMTTVSIGVDYMVLILQTISGIFMTLMMWVAYLPFPTAHWNWLIIPFNILPIIFWRWRKYWALPYVGVLLLWCMAMLLSPHMLVEMTHILFVIAFALVLLKQSNAKQFVLLKLSAFIKKLQCKNNKY